MRSSVAIPRQFFRVPLVLALLAVLSGCAVGPNYQRPAVNTPSGYRTPASAEAPPAEGAQSFGDLGWWEVFRDTQLAAYISEALSNNWDIKIAASRVLQAEAQHHSRRRDHRGEEVRESKRIQEGKAGPEKDPFSVLNFLRSFA